MRGQFKLWSPARRAPFILPNTVVDEGEIAFLRMLFRDETTIAGGANFYIGLCDQLPQETDGLIDVTSEPTSANGYARQPVTRNNVGWPEEIVVSGVNGIRSDTVSWQGVGGPFDKPISRLFLCDVASGSVGTLFAYSGALTTAITIGDAQVWDAQYEFFAN